MKRSTTLTTLFCMFSFILSAQTSLTVNIDAGGLKDSLTLEQVQNVINLTVTGSMNKDDLFLIHNDMLKLEFLNIQNVVLDTIPAKAFYGNERIQEIKLPVHIKYLGESAFEKTFIDIVVTGMFPGFGDNAFKHYNLVVPSESEFYKMTEGIVYSNDGKTMFFCYHVGMSQEIAEGTEVIADRAFNGATIRRLTFPGSLKKIGENTFMNISINEYIGPNSGPISMTFKSEVPPVLAKGALGKKEDIFNYIPFYFIRVPEGCVEVYRNADPQWSIFERIVEEGDDYQGSGLETNSLHSLSISKTDDKWVFNSEKAIKRMDIFSVDGSLLYSKKCNDTHVQLECGSFSEINVVKILFEDDTSRVIKLMN